MAVSSETNDPQASDYQTLPKPRTRLSPEVQFAPTCMMWCIALGIGLMIGMAVLWGVSHIGTLDFGLLFR